MITANKTGCCFITVDAYAMAVGIYMKNGFKFLGEKERKGYEEWTTHMFLFRNNLKDINAAKKQRQFK